MILCYIQARRRIIHPVLNAPSQKWLDIAFHGYAVLKKFLRMKNKVWKRLKSCWTIANGWTILNDNIILIYQPFCNIIIKKINNKKKNSQNELTDMLQDLSLNKSMLFKSHIRDYSAPWKSKFKLHLNETFLYIKGFKCKDCRQSTTVKEKLAKHIM